MKVFPHFQLQRSTVPQQGNQWNVGIGALGSSPISIQSNGLLIGWPDMSQIVYPGQTLRVNTGIISQQAGTGMQLKTYPSPSLLQSGMNSFPDMVDVSDPRNGTQITHTIQNTNQYPVKIDHHHEHRHRKFIYKEGQSMPSPSITRLNPITLQPQGFMEKKIDWGNLLNCAVQVGLKILPLIK